MQKWSMNIETSNNRIKILYYLRFFSNKEGFINITNCSNEILSLPGLITFYLEYGFIRLLLFHLAKSCI